MAFADDGPPAGGDVRSAAIGLSSGLSLPRLRDFLSSLGLARAEAEESVAAEESSEASTTAADVPIEWTDRSTWGAVGGRGEPIGQVDEVIIHHFWRPSLPGVVSSDVEADLMRLVERSHLGNGWSGFGYNFVIFQSGRVYEGRGWGRDGAHTVGRNDRSVGIAFAIDGDAHRLTPEAWEAARLLVERGVADGHLSENVRVSAHTDYAPKSCPGKNIAPHIHNLVPRR